MVKTRKTCKNMTTTPGLHIWYKSVFEKLGWIVLANKQEMKNKVEEYKSSVHRLHNSLECKIARVKEHDRRDDLQIMLSNVKVLLEHVNRDF